MTLLHADLAILARDFPVSHALLTHDDLMTRALIRHFGAVHAVQTAIEDAGNSITRRSTLYQTATGAALLKAILVINKPELPDGLLDRLRDGTRLFGALLIDAGIAVRMEDRAIYRKESPGGDQAGVWGRRLRILHASGDGLLCDVDECLVEEALLRRLEIGRTAP